MKVQDTPKEPAFVHESPHSDEPEELYPSTQYVNADKLARKLSARQVQMIAISGTIGTGLFLGTGKALATGGPASMLIAYAICGGIVFVTMLCLGEMVAYIPIAGSFCTFTGCVSGFAPFFLNFQQIDSHSRFLDDALGFSLTWNCWLSDTVSPASDVIALQLLLEYWTDHFPGWAISLIFLAVVIVLNLLSVKFYGEASLNSFCVQGSTEAYCLTG